MFLLFLQCYKNSNNVKKKTIPRQLEGKMFNVEQSLEVNRDCTTVVCVVSDTSAASEGTWDPPGIGLLIAVVEWLKALLLLLLAKACGVGHFEEGGCKLYEPARVDGSHLPHVLLGSQHQLVIDHPTDKKDKILVKKRTLSSCLPAGHLNMSCSLTTQAVGWTEHWMGECTQPAGL